MKMKHNIYRHLAFSNETRSYALKSNNELHLKTSHGNKRPLPRATVVIFWAFGQMEKRKKIYIESGSCCLLLRLATKDWNAIYDEDWRLIFTKWNNFLTSCYICKLKSLSLGGMWRNNKRLTIWIHKCHVRHFYLIASMRQKKRKRNNLESWPREVQTH